MLTPGGVAVIHHADATERGLHVESQFDSWGPGGRHELSALGDAIIVCRRAGSGAAPVVHAGVCP